MFTLAENTYGKSSVRLMKVKRDGPLHTVKEWKVEILLSGDFAIASQKATIARFCPPIR